MTNFILPDPKIVFIHLPKTAGTSVKAALGGRVAQRFFGHIPKRYAEWARLAVIREPKARFLSAFRMFKYGNDGVGDYYTQPRWPDLTIAKALDVLEDPWIGHDRSARNLSWNLKHHLIPQTHPFNCLHLATRVLRLEQLDSDFARACAELGLTATLPKLRPSRGPTDGKDTWTAEDEARFRRLFAADYEVLGYGADGNGKMQLPPRAETDETVYQLWSAYFSSRVIGTDRAATALPDPDVALEPFVDCVIPGRPEASWAGRSKDLNAHFHKLQPEFSGSSRLSHLLACTIVVIRRDPACLPAQRLFWRILDEQFDAIRGELSLRWLVAIADTLTDLGRSDVERATALNASVFANSCKLYETELSVFYPERPWPPKARLSRGGPLFDGMITYWTEKGDMVENMFARSAAIAERTPVAGQVLMEVIERLRIGPTVYRRFGRIAGQPAVPLVTDEVRTRMQRMMKRRL
ncbi:sulfotransferase family protein [Roseobacter sinensis]|uniref:Sulfotransferase family protein n=1 Tax=Roseobacter sinensis TaxID=2931391 RepID=A0ABT3BGG7_9RHOB|nr:sulfotransferase family protein [Roseobacter sp. WL0113]MCV3272671.1 sulfotransferase family protein [Roseobacter sp. WL0113]